MAEINAKGGIDGAPLEAVFEDSQTLARAGVSAITKLENLVSTAAQKAAGVRGVRAGCGPGDQFTAVKDRLDNHHVIRV